MNKSLKSIKQRVGNIQFGLLRVRDENDNFTLQVKIAENDGMMLSCLITDTVPGQDLLYKNVTLIQKSQGDYLYISGIITDELAKNKKILSVEINKACWFIKKSRGNVSWLQQKYLYETLQDKIEAA